MRSDIQSVSATVVDESTIEKFNVGLSMHGSDINALECKVVLLSNIRPTFQGITMLLCQPLES